MRWKDRIYLGMNGKMDLNLSKEQKIEVLRRALNIIAKTRSECTIEGKTLYMCIAVKYACDELGIKYDDSVSIANIIPESVKYMPKNIMSIHRPWFDSDNRGIRKRLNILNKLIEELSNESE